MIKIAVMLLGLVIMVGTAGAADNDLNMNIFQIMIQMFLGISLFIGSLIAILMEDK